MPDSTALPTGTVTFLFTDLERSTRLLEAHPAAYREAVTRHHELLRGAVEAAGGVVFETLGEGVYAAFAQATDAVDALRAAGEDIRDEYLGRLSPPAWDHVILFGEYRLDPACAHRLNQRR